VPILVLLTAAMLHSGAGLVPLAEAEQALVEGRFEAVRDRAIEALEGGLPDALERARAHELLGIAEAAFGREAEALVAFRLMLGHAPGHVLPDRASPKLIALLERARELGPLTPVASGAPGPATSTPPGFVSAALGPSESAAGVQQGRPLLSQWWFWGAVGAVGLGAGIATWQLARPELARGSLGAGVLR